MVAEPIEEFYTTKEILEKFGISNSWLFKMAKERNIPKTVVRGKTLWSRKHVDNTLSDKQPTETVAEEWEVGKQSRYDNIDNQQSGTQLTM